MARTEVRPETPSRAVKRFPGRGKRARLRELIDRHDLRDPLAVFGLTRLLFLLLTYFGVVLFANPIFQGAHPSLIHGLLPAWDRWDTKWYEQIAQRGYTWRNPAGTSPAAFFPLYPLLIHAGTIVTHRSALLVALVISNLCFLGALWYLWRLTCWETGREVATRTILYIALFPTALFFFAGYTESLFLLLTVAGFYHLRRNDWLLAGMFGALAAATRVTGVLLLVPLVYEYARSRNFSPSRVLSPGLIGLLLVPVGLVAFMVYLQATVGDPLAFDHFQAAWQKVFTLQLWSGFLESLRQVLLVQPAASFFEAQNFLNAVLGGLCLVWSFQAARRLPAAYGLYLLAFWLLTLSTPALAGGYPVPLVSLGRYVLSLFPVFMYLGMVGRHRAFHDGYLVLGTGMLAVLTLLFIHGGWIV